MKIIIVSFLAMSMFQACSGLNIGSGKGQCEGQCDYSRAGVCTDVITIYKNRHNLKNRYIKHYPLWFDKDPYPNNK